MPEPGLIAHSAAPYNAEPPLSRLIAGFITPQAELYVRSHGDVPRIDADTHRLEVGGKVATRLGLSMAGLRDRFEPRTVTAALQCAGNRRADLGQVRPVLGDLWAAGAIGNAEWTGACLADVLRAAGADLDAGHVAFAAADRVTLPGEDAFNYCVSIPMAKALHRDTILAYAINGDALAPEHGYPLRVIAPGYAGVRSAKWLTGITVQDAPSDSPIQQRDYKLLPPGVGAETVDWSQGMTIDEMPLNSAICDPEAGGVPAGLTRLLGYAVATGRSIARVDVSADGGRSWTQATLEHPAGAPWAWTRWRATLGLRAGRHELAVRAWDSAGQTQPASLADVWNFKGYLSAAWHRVQVTAR